MKLIALTLTLIILIAIYNQMTIGKMMIKGKKVLVLGGTKGIGAELARFLSTENDVTIAARNFNKNLKYKFINVDINKPDTLNRLDDNYDYVFCCPGYCKTGYFESLTAAEFYKSININYIGMVNVIRYFLAKSDSKCTFILFSSTTAYYPLCGYDSYTPSKSALNSLFYILDQEYHSNDKIHFKLFNSGNMKSKSYEQENLTKPVFTKNVECISSCSTPEHSAKYLLKHINDRKVISYDWFSYFLAIKNECELLIDYVLFPIAILVVFCVKLRTKRLMKFIK
ncbi:TSC10 [Hepatospora eriocheir]|uniref:TSC10 n=1 Tax=Hepatospora eriocheir TaxID=1081669 RepID=A0A1X0QEG7_9MICR|nr:TSC10 [Hepatospora eriocheir]